MLSLRIHGNLPPSLHITAGLSRVFNLEPGSVLCKVLMTSCWMWHNSVTTSPSLLRAKIALFTRADHDRRQFVKNFPLLGGLFKIVGTFNWMHTCMGLIWRARNDTWSESIRPLVSAWSDWGPYFASLTAPAPVWPWQHNSFSRDVAGLLYLLNYFSTTDCMASKGKEHSRNWQGRKRRSRGLIWNIILEFFWRK